MLETTSTVSQLRWSDLSDDYREGLTGKLAGMWGHPSDEEAFNALLIHAQQALLLILARMQAKGLWQLVQQISNVWGEGGVGCEFTAWPLIHSTLSGRSDFTRLFANHSNTDGGFVEKDRTMSVMHFLYVDGTPRKWSLHFDLYNPLHSPAGAWRHLRHEVIGKVKPDWQNIQAGLDD